MRERRVATVVSSAAPIFASAIAPWTTLTSPRSGEDHFTIAGANSVFYGDKLLTTGNPEVDADRAFFGKLGLATAV